jgi:exopolyphosphatase/guanosine-5'-triphosphate,3'-diphosphate pyrophosphatase
MAIARQHHGQLQLLDKLQEKVQLADGLDKDQLISPSAEKRALECLDRFRQRLQGLPKGCVRVVGTNTFRVAKNAYEFIRKAEAVLGYPIEVISGREEARLIYLGIAHCSADDQQSRLVIDIGGGSTECIIGSRFEPIMLGSLHMGCVRYKRFFPDNTLGATQLARAIDAAKLEIESIKADYLRQGWQECLGSSGSIKSILHVCVQSGLSAQSITRPALDALYKQLSAARSADELDFPGLKPDRRQIFPPGFAILYALFDQLGLSEMQFADGALREGVLYDLVGRLFHEDVRDRAIKTIQQRYSVDVAQANRVTQTAQQLAHGLAKDSKSHLPSTAALDLLTKACAIHEIGLAISHTKYHRHSAYLAEHSDLPGFSQQEQIALALLLRNHRRKLSFKPIEHHPNNIGLSHQTMVSLVILLRLATVLNRARADTAIALKGIHLTEHRCTLSFEAGWLSANPLIALSLAEEANFLSAADITLITE